MREIKFRAWDKASKRMLNVDEIDFDCTCITTLVTPPHNAMAVLQFEDIELMQFTGLKDKHGVEIYEGDILRITDPYGEESWIDDVVYKCGAFQIEVRHDDYDVTAVGWADEFSLEVVGNVYEKEAVLESNC